MTKLPHDGLVRFHAYLDPVNQWVIGHANELDNGLGPAVLRPLSRFNDRTTLWSPYYINETQFQLRWADSPRLYLAWTASPGALRLTTEPLYISGSHQPVTLFTIDDLDPSPWFALNNDDKSLVADIREEGMVNGNDVIGFPWNGGGNQRWRFEQVNR